MKPFLLLLLVGSGVFGLSYAVNAETVSKTWVYNSDMESWQDEGSKSYGSWSWINFGNPAGGLNLGCSGVGVSCSAIRYFYLQGTYESIFGIPAGSIIDEITINGNIDAYKANSLPSVYVGRIELIDDSTHTLMNEKVITSYATWVNKTFDYNYIPNSSNNISNTNIELKTYGRVTKTARQGNTANINVDNLTFEIDYTPASGIMSWLIPTIYANTDCTYTTSTVTCIDSKLTSTTTNPTVDVFNGMILFLIMFFGLLFYFRKGVRI